MPRPNGPQFHDVLFHGSSDRFTTLKKGDYVVPGRDIGVEQHHEDIDYPDASRFAHATYSRREAFTYANWTAKGAHGNAELHGDANPIVYMVEPAVDQKEDPHNPETGVRSRKGFRVLGTIHDDLGDRD